MSGGVRLVGDVDVIYVMMLSGSQIVYHKVIG
jgi:hypothetical protein